MANSIKTLSGCSKLKDRSFKLDKKKINQKCSRRCSNVVKNGNIFMSFKKGKILSMGLFKEPNLCGYVPKPKSKSKSKTKKSKAFKKKQKLLMKKLFS